MERDLFVNDRQVLKNKWEIENLKQKVAKGGSLSDDAVFTVKVQDFYYTANGNEELYEWLQEKADELGYTLEDKNITYIDDSQQVVTQDGKLLSRVIYYRNFKDFVIDSEEFGKIMNDSKLSIIQKDGDTDNEFKGYSYIIKGKTITTEEELYTLLADELGFAKNDLDLISVFKTDNIIRYSLYQ